MLPLATEPTAADFTSVHEYKSSTPKTFALNETPVLFLSAETTCSGVVAGRGRVWISSSGLSVWIAHSGVFIAQDEIVLHAKQGTRVYVQGGDFELWMEGGDASELYAALLECLEHTDPSGSPGSSEDSFDGSPLDDSIDHIYDLESGQGDDESWGANSHPQRLSSAQVHFHNSLGKRPRES